MQFAFRVFQAILMLIICGAGAAQAQDKPNILVNWGDDVGQSNISAYTFGLMGYRSPTRISRQDRNRRASVSIRSWRSCRTPAARSSRFSQ